MMTNMFSIFDPSTSMNFSLNWLIIVIIMFILNWSYWIIPSRFNFLWNYFFKFLMNEFMSITSKKMKLNMIIFLTLFIFIGIMNSLSLMPYIFTPTSHLSLNLSFSLSMWISFMIFGWYKNSNHMFIHLVPLNTPSLLMMFMVMIETISNFIRPWTLMIRLSANMLAGHLLFSLLGSSMENSSYFLPLMIMIQNMLLLLEMSVSLIQAYVFSILTLLYFNEVI